jgi:hypothetical protein
VLKYVCNRLKGSSNNLCRYKVGFLTSNVTIIPFLVKPITQGRGSISQVKLADKEIVIHDSLLPILSIILNNLVYLYVGKLLRKPYAS